MVYLAVKAFIKTCTISIISHRYGDTLSRDEAVSDELVERFKSQISVRISAKSHR